MCKPSSVEKIFDLILSFGNMNLSHVQSGDLAVALVVPEKVTSEQVRVIVI